MRKFLVFIAGSCLLFFLFVLTTSAVAVITLTPAHLKTWLRQGNVYDTVLETLTKQGQNAVSNSGGSDTSQPEVQAALKQAVTPEVLQTSTEKLIDGVTPWLDSKVVTPTFAIDVSSVKQSFLQSLADQARTKYASLPVCAKGQIPDTSDIFNINCQVPGVSVEPQIQQAIQDFNNKQDFLANPVITADTLKVNDNGTKEPVFQKLNNVPKYYKWARIAPFIFGVLVLGSILIVIFASSERRNGIRRVTIALATAGIFLLAGVWLASFGINQVQNRLIRSASNDSVVQSTLIAVIKSIQNELNRNTMIFAGVFLVLAGGMLIYLLVTKPKSPKPPEGTDHSMPIEEKPVEPSTSEPKRAPKPPTLVQVLI